MTMVQSSLTSGTLTITVKSAITDAPLSGATVWLDDGGSGGSYGSYRSKGVTDNQGLLVIQNVPFGMLYSVKVTLNGYQDSMALMRGSLSTNFHNNNQHFLMSPEPSVRMTGSIYGKAVLSDGSGVQGVSVSVDKPFLPYPATTTTGNDGSFTVPNLYSGTYSVKFVKSGYVDVQNSVTLTSTSPPSNERTVAVLVPATSQALTTATTASSSQPSQSQPSTPTLTSSSVPSSPQQPPAQSPVLSFQVPINQGWNILSTAVFDMSLSECSLSDFTSYSYDRTAKQYSRYAHGSGAAPDSVWVYSPKACTASGAVPGNADVSLSAGWNFISLTQDMTGHALGEFEGNCQASRAYMYGGNWRNMLGSATIQQGDVGQGMVIKVASDCTLGFVQNTLPGVPGSNMLPALT
ncbi:carboxypeptidase regulatory-like domain-containing protein [Candidatus Woesearchaeota archaeon]|nr:carboxypeptidase regulatory-like domain-containing protein [Candidatus Woesearchaeota archaeon]